MRNITLEKYDLISAYIFTYLEEYSKYTPEELERLA